MILLYVDDDPDDIDVFKEAVKKVAPHSVLHTATRARDAFRKLDEMVILPEYIFLDINMPEITGIDFLRKLNETKKFTGVPVVIYSTSISETDAEECKRLGAVDFIKKPYGFQQLCEILKRFF